MLHNEEELKEIYELIPDVSKSDIERINNLIIGDRVEFPMHVFPSEIYDFITDRHQALYENKNFLIIGALSATASAIGAKVQTDFQHKNKPIFWNAVVAPTGEGKSSPVNAMIQPIHVKYNTEQEIFKTQYEQYEIEKKRAKKEKKPFEMKEPVFKEHATTDLTYEGLITSHQNNKDGLIIHVDELLAMVKAFGAYKNGKGGDQQNFLTMHDGGPIRKTRASQEKIGISESCVNIIGGFQPGVIQQFFADSRSEDGFIYRFLYVFQKEKTIRPIKVNERDKNLEVIYSNYINALYDNYKERVLTFSKEAQQIFAYWSHTCSKYYINDVSGSAYQSKLDKYAHRLALLFHVYNKKDESDLINKDDILLSIHALEFYRREFNKMIEYSFGERVDALSTDYSNLYHSLNDNFSWSEAKKCAEEFNIRETSLKKFLKKKQLFRKVNHGQYCKNH
jgi:hypothetical protein